jgi:benzodiazapine receptor
MSHARSTTTQWQRLSLPDLLALGVLAGLCFATAAVGSLFTVPAIAGWYADLARPSWTPPNWVFTPVWLTLFALMALAGWLVWLRRNHASVVLPFTLFGLQLVLNAAWSFLFFTLQSPGAAFGEILVLLLAILATVVVFARVSTTASLLLLPYLFWVGYAAVLNFALWRMNG